MEAATETSGRPEGKTRSEWHRHWQTEMTAAEKRLKEFTRRGNATQRRYQDEMSAAQDDGRDNEAFSLNLFYVNITTQLSMLYGQTPKIDVSREHQDPTDDVARVSGLMLKRMLEADVRNSGEDCAVVLKSCLQDRLLPGLGVARVRYTYGTTKVVDMATKEEREEIVYEDAPVDYVHWQDFRWGWARNWKELPWMAFRSYLRKDEVEKRFPGYEDKLKYKNQMPAGPEAEDEDPDRDQKNHTEKAEIWEIWSKEDKKVFWWSNGCHEVLDAKDDPLKLDGFWPTPKPMMANITTTKMIPVPDFVMAQDLYNEIDQLQTRIAKLTTAVKATGVYDSSAGDSVGRMLQHGGDNKLIPVENWAMFAEKGGLVGAVQWYDANAVVNTMQTLAAVRDQTIELLYQITGMSDILRGANTDQYTSDGTNQLKAKFGSIRIQALQDDFARFASDIEALKAEVISKHFKIESIARQSGAQWLPQADHDKIQPAIQLIKSPDIKWRIDIRPESIAMVDYAQLKQERTEYLTAISTFLQSANSMVQAVPGSLPVLLEMLKWGMAGFRGSDYLEGIMDTAIEAASKAPPPGQDDGKGQEAAMKLQIEQMKLQLQQMKGEQDLQKIQAKSAADLKTTQAKVQGELAKINLDGQKDMTLEQTHAQNALREIAEDLQADLAKIRANMEADLTIEQAQAQFDIAEQDNDHENTLREIRANAMASGAQQGNREE